MIKNPLIYYLDDDADDLAFFEEATTGLALKIRLFDSAEALFTACHEKPLPQMVFLDINMPRKDGFTVLKEIRSAAALAQLPVVMLSTSTAESCIDRSFKLGASYYLAKPTSVEELRLAMAVILKVDWATHQPQKSNFVIRPKLK